MLKERIGNFLRNKGISKGGSIFTIESLTLENSNTLFKVKEYLIKEIFDNSVSVFDGNKVKTFNSISSSLFIEPFSPNVFIRKGVLIVARFEEVDSALEKLKEAYLKEFQEFKKIVDQLLIDLRSKRKKLLSVDNFSKFLNPHILNLQSENLVIYPKKAFVVSMEYKTYEHNLDQGFIFSIEPAVLDEESEVYKSPIGEFVCYDEFDENEIFTEEETSSYEESLIQGFSLSLVFDYKLEDNEVSELTLFNKLNEMFDSAETVLIKNSKTLESILLYLESSGIYSVSEQNYL